MLGNSHFYNRTIRKTVVAFGTLFNDLVLVRYNKAGIEQEKTRVPLSYATKEKYLTRLTSDPNLTKSIATYVPRMTFEMTGMSYDNSRKFNSITKNYGINSSTGAVTGQYNPVPYNFEFSLSLYVRNTEDGTQLLEQILPFFTPDFTVTVDFIPAIGRKFDLPIILESVTPLNEYEGDMASGTRIITWDLTFTVKGYIFPPATTPKIIKEANTNIYISLPEKTRQQIYVDTASGNGVFTTGETVRTVSSGKTGKVLYFANNSTGTMIVSDLSDLLEEGEVIVGDYTHAKYTINTIDWNPIKNVVIVTTPNPADANADSDYGFSETITENPY